MAETGKPRSNARPAPVKGPLAHPEVAAAKPAPVTPTVPAAVTAPVALVTAAVDAPAQVAAKAAEAVVRPLRKAPAPVKPAAAKPAAPKPVKAPASRAEKIARTEAFSEAASGPVAAEPTAVAAMTAQPLVTAVAPLVDTAMPIVTPSFAAPAPAIQPLAEGATGFARVASDMASRGAAMAGQAARTRPVPGPERWLTSPFGMRNEMGKALEDMATAQGSYAEAMMRSGQLFAKGLEEWGRAWSDIARSRVEEGMAAARDMLQVSTMDEWSRKQQDYVRSSFDSAVSDGTRLSELGLRVTSEALEPINRELSAAVDRFSRVTA